MGFLTGKNKSQQSSTSENSSSNRAYDTLSAQLNPQLQAGSRATSAYQDLLGLNGQPANQTAFRDYLNNSGYNFAFDEGMRGINAANSAGGGLYSGAALRGATRYGQNLGSQYFDKYLQQLQGQMGQGNTAANLLAGAGGVSNGTSSSSGYSTNNPGLAPLIGSAAQIAAMGSDRRLKTEIRQIGKLMNGLAVYSYRYKWTNYKTFGVMADEVEEKFPEALGPTILGYKTVNYSKLIKE